MKEQAGGPGDRPKMKNKEYMAELRKLQVELCYLQEWAKATGARIIMLFEGRDTAGKGGIIKAISERVSPRTFRIEALPAPTEREKTQLFMQRYISRFPSGGEIVIFDRSWYNRAGVEYVMGFCSEKDHDRFLAQCPLAERWIKASGEKVIIIFEGRDAAGKGGTIKAITERVSPRIFRVVALPAPSDREKSELLPC